MGGPGSTRWDGYEKKTTVEECLHLSISAFTRRGLIEAGDRNLGLLSWQDPLREGEVTSVAFKLEWRYGEPELSLHYTAGKGETAKRGYQLIRFESTGCPVSGNRWWFLCPSTGPGDGCDKRRCGKLYLPPGSRLFLCRECHDLTYQSSQRGYSPRDTRLRNAFRRGRGYKSKRVNLLN